ncbi:MAG: hypothetical protein GC131_02395 [Alphaproteobacteria bacterium]|nr:hypothetical protein [Alphaproteobacteria bacterium]
MTVHQEQENRILPILTFHEFFEGEPLAVHLDMRARSLSVRLADGRTVALAAVADETLALLHRMREVDLHEKYDGMMIAAYRLALSVIDEAEQVH